MEIDNFWNELHQRIGRFDLLTHPFYVAWTHGELKQSELADYAVNYYSHVAAFPQYLETLAARLPAGQTKELVMQNREEELGCNAPDKRSHADLWLDFATAVGGAADGCESQYPEISHLVEHFYEVARNGTELEALSAFYAYESQVPAVADSKERGLQEYYSVDPRGRYYFALHKTYDLHHARVWRDEISRLLEKHPDQQGQVLSAAEKSAQMLWLALDGIERVRLQKRSA